ncbi:arsenate reductase [Ferruginibacter sp.]
MSKLIIYGIPNCDTTKKAMSWLQKNNIAFSFHDYKLQGIDNKKLAEWCNIKGWETIFNKRSTTWRELPAAAQAKLTGQETAIKMMMEHTSIIKRPIVEYNGKLIVGYNESEYKGLLK